MTEVAAFAMGAAFGFVATLLCLVTLARIAIEVNGNDDWDPWGGKR